MLLWLLLALPPLRGLLESAMPLHMLVQLPLLALVGVLAGLRLRARLAAVLDRHDPHGIAMLLAAVFMTAFWMLPRSLDAAIETLPMEFFKFTSIPLLIGVPLALAWQRLHPVARAFVFGNFLSMLAVLGWLYLVAPVRLCNYYAVGEQALTGRLLLLIALICLLSWCWQALRGDTGNVKTRAPAKLQRSVHMS
jgi:Na+/citrate or Na+/malate symporter